MTPGTRLQEAETFLTAAVALRPRVRIGTSPARHRLPVTGKVGPGDRLLSGSPPPSTRRRHGLQQSWQRLREPVESRNEAIAAYREAIRLRPSYDLPYGNLLAVLGNQGRLAEAIATCRDAIKRCARTTSDARFPGRLPLLAGAGSTRRPPPMKRPGSGYPPTLSFTITSATPCFSWASIDRAIAEYREAIRLAPGFCRCPLAPRAGLDQSGEAGSRHRDLS